jgi:hypothetical protein
METAHALLRIEKRSLVQWKIVPTSFVWIIVFFDGPFEYGDCGNFKLLRWMQNLLRHSTWDHEMLYADRSSMDKQLLVIPLLRKTKNTNMEGGWLFKFILYFIERTLEHFNLDIRSSVHWNTMDIPTICICIIIFFDGDFDCGSGSTFWGYVGTNAELLCVEFYNFLQCDMFVSHLSCHC